MAIFTGNIATSGKYCALYNYTCTIATAMVGPVLMAILLTNKEHKSIAPHLFLFFTFA